MLEFWCGFLWICSLFLVGKSFILYWSFCCLSIWDLFICWHFLQFISKMTWSNYHTSLLIVWLEIAQNIFLLFKVIVKSLVSTIFFSDHFLFVYRRIKDFCMLIWIQLTLLSVFISYRNFLMEFFRQLMNTIISQLSFCSWSILWMLSYSNFLLFMILIQ